MCWERTKTKLMTDKGSAYVTMTSKRIYYSKCTKPLFPTFYFLESLSIVFVFKVPLPLPPVLKPQTKTDLVSLCAFTTCPAS